MEGDLPEGDFWNAGHVLLQVSWVYVSSLRKFMELYI